MGKYGKTIKIFLIDGEPNGRMSCELSNWTGKAYKIPRKKIKDSFDREDLQGTGIYILLGKDDALNKVTAYIGEAEAIFKRLQQHITSKDFWNEVLVFVSKDENLNKAHIKFIESRLYEIAKEVNRCNLENAVIPNKPKISESDEAEMEEFIANVKLLVNTLGFRIFEELRDKNQTNEEQEKSTFYLKSSRGTDAKGQLTNEGFVVLTGSAIATSYTKSYPKYCVKLREKLLTDEVLVEKNNKIVFVSDFLFNSPSAAASLVAGRSANGLMEWKLKNGQTIKEIE